MSRWMTGELGSRLERPIHLECKLNEPMHIGMRLLHPAAADHSVSISRQQVQRIFSFSLTFLTPLEILMIKIFLKYIPIHIHNFEHSRVIMNMTLSSHGFWFHRNTNRRENKAQIPLIIHNNEKKTKNIFLVCS